MLISTSLILDSIIALHDSQFKRNHILWSLVQTFWLFSPSKPAFLRQGGPLPLTHLCSAAILPTFMDTFVSGPLAHRDYCTYAELII